MKTTKINNEINYINPILNKDYGHTNITGHLFKNKKVLIIERAYLMDCIFENIGCLILKYCSIHNGIFNVDTVLSIYSSFNGDLGFSNAKIIRDEKAIKLTEKYLKDFKPVFLYPPGHPIIKF